MVLALADKDSHVGLILLPLQPPADEDFHDL
jgi:hypothetical protein